MASARRQPSLASRKAGCSLNTLRFRCTQMSALMSLGQICRTWPGTGRKGVRIPAAASSSLLSQLPRGRSDTHWTRLHSSRPQWTGQPQSLWERQAGAPKSVLNAQVRDSRVKGLGVCETLSTRKSRKASPRRGQIQRHLHNMSEGAPWKNVPAVTKAVTGPE